MTTQISSDFSSSSGQFQIGSGWDGTEHSEAAKGFLSTQRHVDIRNFRVFNALVPVPQSPDLEEVAQTVLEGEIQTAMEQKFGAAIVTENWVFDGGGTGLTGLTVGAISGRGGWSGLTATTNGSAISQKITSADPANPVSLLGMTYVSVVFPDYHAFDTTSSIQFTSDVNGVFGNGHDSVARPFSASGTAMPLVRHTVASFAATGFDNTHITGVQVWLKKAVAPAPALVVSMMAIRGIGSAWTESAIDFDTRLQALVPPVTLDGLPYGGSTGVAFEFVRGGGDKSDPIPADGAFYLYFYPGGSTTPNDATGGTVNKLAFILREQKSIDDGTGSHIQVRITWNDTSSHFEVANVSSTGGSPGVVIDTVIYSETIGPTFNPLKRFVFKGQIKGTQILASIYETDIERTVGDFVWQNGATITDASFTWQHGRVGMIADLRSRDSYLDDFDVAPSGFAKFETNRYVSRTPVDGVQLSAVYSPDENLFDSFTGPDIFIDSTKTLTGLGSFRTQRSLTTNSFIVDDWLQSYLTCAIWAPSNVTRSNQPIILLNTGSGQENIALPRLQPSQWNLLDFDLGLFRNLITASDYSLTISAAPSPDRALGYFWVDNVVVGRRRVSWAARATTDGEWREFKNLANDPKGAIHFNPDDRGTQLQLKAEALTADAWVSSFKLFPRYAQLGLPLYDQAFESD